jgi:anti-sigma factor RsiW
MTCEELRQILTDFLTGELSPARQAAVREHCSGCAACRRELEEVSALWNELGVLPEEQPGERLRTNFYQMLSSYQAGLAGQPSRPRFNPVTWLRQRLLPLSPAWQMALVVLVLVTGWITRPLLFPQAPDPRYSQIQQEMEHLRQTVALSMIRQSSAADRLQAVTWGARLNEPSPEVVQALLDTLAGDPNVNVRLAAAEALFSFRRETVARKGLLTSLQKQDSPLVQLALIDYLVRLDEPETPNVLREFLQRPMVNPAVTKEAKNSLEQLGKL